MVALTYASVGSSVSRATTGRMSEDPLSAAALDGFTSSIPGKLAVSSISTIELESHAGQFGNFPGPEDRGGEPVTLFSVGFRRLLLTLETQESRGIFHVVEHEMTPSAIQRR